MSSVKVPTKMSNTEQQKQLLSANITFCRKKHCSRDRHKKASLDLGTGQMWSTNLNTSSFGEIHTIMQGQLLKRKKVTVSSTFKSSLLLYLPCPYREACLHSVIYKKQNSSQHTAKHCRLLGLIGQPLFPLLMQPVPHPMNVQITMACPLKSQVFSQT